MIVLITGVPGSGKTLYAMTLIAEYLKQGRPVFADIDGVSMDGVLDGLEDWREAPDGSVVVYDECQQKFGPDQAGRSANPIISELEVHRHRGMDIILITQHPKLLHSHIRRLVGRHYEVRRMYGAQTAKIFRADRQIDVDKIAQLMKEDSFMWPYPKQFFNTYKSATVHTHKAQLPAWAKRSAIALLVIFCLTAGLAYSSRGFFTGQSPIQQKVTQQSPAPSVIKQPDNSDKPEKKTDSTPIACISSSKRCQCYGEDMKLIEMPLNQCQQVASAPLAMLR